jgi:SAM-dependent methyltransferase
VGTTRAILRLLKEEHAENPASLSKLRVLDIGCGQGAMLEHICTRLSLEGVGFDLRPALQSSGPIPIFTGNAIDDPLPPADIAICVMMAHHLSPVELERMIDNVSRTCQRFVIVDLVRHQVPLILFKIFLCPFLSRLNALDGQTSIRRAYTAREMKQIAQRATRDGATQVHLLQHSVAPFWIRQVVDIRWERTRREANQILEETGR